MVKKVFSAAVFAAALAVVLAGCPKPEEEEKPSFPDEFVGTWYKTSSGNTIRFANDDGGKIFIGTADTDGYNLDSVDGSKYTILYPGDNFSLTMAVNGASLTISQVNTMASNKPVAEGTYTKQ